MIAALSNNVLSDCMMEENSDRDHLRKFSNGDNDAFYAIFRKYEKSLIKYIYGFTFDSELSKDICQETFLRLINRPPLFFLGDSIKPWLFKVARNKSIDALRSRHSKGASETELYNQSKNCEEHPSELLSQDENIGRLKSAMKNIPEMYREIVSLRVYGRLTFNEISKLHGIPMGTALWRMQKAVSLLREEMEKQK
ncbi:MAG: sigma-70 family RNA polymerase sigma factor [Victivallales bacterium]